MSGSIALKRLQLPRYARDGMTLVYEGLLERSKNLLDRPARSKNLSIIMRANPIYHLWSERLKHARFDYLGSLYYTKALVFQEETRNESGNMCDSQSVRMRMQIYVF